MKSTKIIFSVLLLGLLSSKLAAADVNGVWTDSTGTAFSNCTLIFAQKGDSIFLTHYLEFNGTPFVEYGKGIIHSDSLYYKVIVSKGIPGWSTAGIHKLQLSTDGQTLRGTYADNKGNQGPLVFKRKLPAINEKKK